MKDLKNIKKDFTIFQNYPDLVYLDSAATSQKPTSVINAVSDFYKFKNSNVHRSGYRLAELATETYENTRIQIGEFINARSSNEIIFTGNTNQSINYVAYGWARKFLVSGDIVVLSEMEHHANVVPWLRLKEEKKIKLLFIPINKEYRLDYKPIFENEKNLQKIKMLALTHASNVLGTVNPLKEIISYIRRKKSDIKILIDAAQSIPHLPINVQKLDIDFLTFSSHKILGPSGVGILWGRENLLEETDPFFVGSHMVETVTKEKATWSDLPDKFEVGTSNLEGVAGFSAAISYLQSIGLKNINIHEKDLTDYALKIFKQSPFIKLFGPKTSDSRLGIFSFELKGAHPHDVSHILDRQNIAIRSGHHCAQITMKSLGVSSTARASLYIYNSKKDIDQLFTAIHSVKKTLKI